MKGLDKEHVCLTHRHRQQCGDGQREGAGVWKRGAKRGKIMSIIKIKKKL